MRTIWFDKNGVIHNQGIEEYSYRGITVYIDGFIYVYGRKAGSDTIQWLCEEVYEKKQIPYNCLRGAFSCIVDDGKSLNCFTDNSNMHCIYYSEDNVSNSFLEIVKHVYKKGKKIEFSEEALCEYYTLGNIFFEKTFFTDIKILGSEEIIVYESGDFIIKKKGIEGIEGVSALSSISDYFSKLAYSISDLKVCQALTGGYDSRMIYTCLSSRIHDHAAISSNILDHPDVIHAMEVTKTNGDELEVISINKPEYSEEWLDVLLTQLDGIQPIDIDSNIRLLQFKEKLAKDYELHLTGDGGVLHKDWEWIQDFPFYRRKKSDAKKFYLQRLYYIKNDNHLGDTLKPVFLNQQLCFVDHLMKISKSINTQSYDAWYYYVSGNRRVGYNNNPINGLISYAPLDEIDIVRYSYSLPRFQRFFFNSMRKTMTAENVKIARLSTNYGTTASSELPFLVRDVYYQTIEYARKAIRLLGRKLFNKTLLNNNVMDWSFEDEIRKSELVDSAIAFAKNRKYILNTINKENLSYIELQRLIHVFWLAKLVGIA